jgi:hypothetical protein
MTRGSVRSRAAAARILVVGAPLSLSLAGCSLLLDWDLAGSGATSSPDGAPGMGDGTIADGTTNDGAMVDADGGGPATDAAQNLDADADANAALDCDGAQLCDDFENRADALGPPIVGAWSYNLATSGTSFAITNSTAASGAQSFVAQTPSSTGASPLGALIGSLHLPFASAAKKVTASFDMELEYDVNGYAASGLHHFADIYAEGVAGADEETVGIYRKSGGTTLILRTYDGGGTATDLPVAVPLDFRGGFHHCVLEVVFSTSASVGGAALTVDTLPKISIGPARTLRTSVPNYYVTFGSTYAGTAPAMKARFDNVVVRSD